MILYLFVRGRNRCLQNGFYEGAFMHCLQRVKWKIGPVYIFLFLFGAFFIILPYTVLHSAAKHHLMYCLGWLHVEVR